MPAVSTRSDKKNRFNREQSQVRLSGNHWKSNSGRIRAKAQSEAFLQPSVILVSEKVRARL